VAVTSIAATVHDDTFCLFPCISSTTRKQERKKRPYNSQAEQSVSYYSPSPTSAVVVVLLPAVVIVPLVPRFTTRPNVCLLSVDTLNTDSFVCGFFH
jgi:hypothetical protein